MCNSFFKNGYCAYGPRCNFLHNFCSAPSKKSEELKILSGYREIIYNGRKNKQAIL